MVKPMLRTRSRKRVQKRTPGGRVVTHYKAEKAKAKTCARCGEALSGVANATNSELSKLSKSEKIPTRAYAGVLCQGCVESLYRYSTRLEVKYTNPEYSDIEITRDLTLEKFLPRGWFKKLSGS